MSDPTATDEAGVRTTDPMSPSIPDILLASLSALAAAGEVEKACRLAGQAWAALRHTEPATAQRFNVILHRLTPKLS